MTIPIGSRAGHKPSSPASAVSSADVKKGPRQDATAFPASIARLPDAKQAASWLHPPGGPPMHKAGVDLVQGRLARLIAAIATDARGDSVHALAGALREALGDGPRAKDVMDAATAWAHAAISSTPGRPAESYLAFVEALPASLRREAPHFMASGASQVAFSKEALQTVRQLTAIALHVLPDPALDALATRLDEGL